MAQDGGASHLHNNIGRDIFGYSLGYFDGDYAPKAGTSAPAFLADASSSAMASNAPDLYNGNIGHMVTAISALGSSPIVGAAYRYDQLNRLVKAVQYDNLTYDSGFQWGASGHADYEDSDYYADYSYDSNGNLRQLRRNAHGTTNAMDNLFYFYKAHNNQLTHVTDQEGVTFATDLPDQSPDNYAYDLDGNLTSDHSEQIEQILWNASGKVRGIRREEGSGKDDLQFLYDALGNRYGKVAVTKDQTTGERLSMDHWDITMYIRDAQGNPLEIYDYSFDDLGDNEYRESLKLNERILYGSSRLGTEVNINEEVAFAEFSVATENYPYDGNPFAKLSVSSTLVEPDAKYFSLIRGRKHFELTNHLGNVLATVSDKRFPIDGKYSWVLGAAGTGDYNFVDGAFVYDEDNGNYSQDETPDGTIDFYMPKLTMANRYYPFGMVQPNGENVDGSYRFAWNTQECVKEISPFHQTAQFWEYDPRVVQRWNRDPISMAWLSSYSINSGNPIFYTDPNGDFRTKFGAWLYKNALCY